jgi:hypothetical protein
MGRLPAGWPWGEIPPEDLRLFEDSALMIHFLRVLRDPSALAAAFTPIEMEEAPEDLEDAIVLVFPPLGPTAEA